ncbi:hypothetical protein [Tepidiphilus baoligensis]|uniref:Glycosyltransferase n=2 Tax=Tepidiphilus baoligensis TaxID=2698687 RepID=A0ABX1QNU7_9PROT|nr:hypothetical protein [Tepidiphilus baoligensis]
MRIVTLSMTRGLPSGIVAQLEYENSAAQKNASVNWKTVLLTTENGGPSFAQRIPWMFRPMFLRNFYCWIVCLKLAKESDFVLMRHIPFDPFVFIFAPFVKNRISVHHSDEIRELPLVAPGWKGRMASLLERVSGKFSLKFVKGILGVTREIAENELIRSGRKIPSGVYLNGIDVDVFPLADDRRNDKKINIVFVCSVFSIWHGLDKLIKSIENFSGSTPLPVIIHLIGEIDEIQKKEISLLDSRVCIIMHSSMKKNDIMEVYSVADVGLASLALERKGITEATTLKVREMLAAGVPVYSTHRDSALPDNFPYYFMRDDIVFEDIVEIAIKSKSFRRSDVRNISIPYISKQNSMNAVCVWLENSFRDCRRSVVGR